MISKIEQYAIDKATEMREKRNMTQEELASELGVSSGFIGKVESKKFTTHYNLKHLNLLAQVFGCSPRDFLPKQPL